MYATYFDFKHAAYEPAHSNCCGSMPKKWTRFSILNTGNKSFNLKTRVFYVLETSWNLRCYEMSTGKWFTSCPTRLSIFQPVGQGVAVDFVDSTVVRVAYLINVYV